MLLHVKNLSKTLMIAVLFGYCILFSACNSSSTKKSKSGELSPGTFDAPRAFDGTFASKNFDITLGAGDGSEETLWALAQCECAPQLFRPYFEKIAQAKGVLPQILIPTVREQIKGNTALQTLQKIPLGGLLADFFASDDKLNDKVREGLSEKLKKTPGGSNLAERVSFRFDGFPVSAKADSFNVSSQIPRWHAVFSADGLWNDNAKLDGTDHGLQTLELLRTLAEWKYMIGLDENSDGGFYGGMTLRTEGGKTVLNGPIDPRSQKTPAWFISGAYAISYDDKNSRDLATSVKEVWKHTDSAIELDEQARFWHTTARAFSRLRPERRGKLGTVFGSEPESVLPLETHELPMAFLNGLKALLPGPFIDREGRQIHAQAALDESVTPEHASMVTVSRLIRALTAWIVELKSADEKTLSAETLKKVATVPQELLPALQLSVQTILNRHTVPATELGGTYGLALHEDNTVSDLAKASEALVALMEAESKLLQSEFLRERIVQILHWYAGDLLRSDQKVSKKDLLWIRTVASRATEYAGDEVSEWATDAVKFADEKLRE